MRVDCITLPQLLPCPALVDLGNLVSRGRATGPGGGEGWSRPYHLCRPGRQGYQHGLSLRNPV